MIKKKEARKPRAYKIADSAYNRALKKSAKSKTPLATKIEEVVTAIGEGANIIIETA